MSARLRVGTRGSELALFQANPGFGVLPDGSFARANNGASANGNGIEVTGNSAANPDDPATNTTIGFASPFNAATPPF